MNIRTQHFGELTIDAGDILLFPQGLVGLEQCRHWVLLEDADNLSVGWLQSVDNADVCIAVVDPRRFVADHQVRVNRRQLMPLELSSLEQACVLAIVAKTNDRLTINLKAPLIINQACRLGRQVTVNDEQPVKLELSAPSSDVRKAA